MPAPIYLPPDPSNVGNMFARAMQPATQFLWGQLGQRLQQQRANELLLQQQEFEREQATTRFQRAKELVEFEAGLEPSKKDEIIARFEYAKQQGYGGSFVDFYKIGKKGTTTSDKFVKGSPYTDDKGRRTVPVFKKDTMEFVRNEYPGKVKPSAETGTSEANVKERIKQNLLKSFGNPPNVMGQIATLDPKRKISKLTGWLRVRKSKEKGKRFTTEELNNLEQEIMTQIDLPPELQESIRVLRDQYDADEKQITRVLRAYKWQLQNQ